MSSPLPASVAFCADYRTFVDAVLSAERTIRLVSPGLDEPRAQCLATAAESGLDVRVVIDPSEETERHGLGEVRAIDSLRAAGVEVRQLNGNAVGFLLVDGTGYCFFPQSRLFSEEGAGLNAVSVDPFQAQRLERAFFPCRSDDEVKEMRERLEGVLDDLADHVGRVLVTDAELKGVEPLDEEALQEVKEALERNPPRDPNLTRQFSAYTTKLQFIELILKGGTFDSRTVALPDDIPLGVSKALQDKLRTKMRVFSGDELPALQDFRDFRREVDAFRDKYSTYLPSRKMRIFRTEKKRQLLDELAALRKKIPALVAALAADVMAAIGSTEKDLEDEVVRLLMADPPGDYGVFKAHPDVLENVIRRDARRMVSRIRFPEPQEILGRIELKEHFYEMTWEDFSDDDFIRELREAGIVNKDSADELRNLTAAFEAK